VLVVAIVVLAGSVDAEAPRLATELGMTEYETKLALRSGPPAVVLRTPDRQRALDLLSRLRARGHEAVACDQAAIFPSSAMISMRRFALEPDAVVATDVPGSRLPFDDILALLRATHRLRVESHAETVERKFRPAAAIVTGGVVLTKTVTRDVVSTTDERIPVVYLFRRSNERPWLLQATGTHYTTLGSLLRPTQMDNFLTTVRLLRERATSAAFDERLLAVRSLPERITRADAVLAEAAPLAEGLDVLAHLLALWYAHRGPTAYRG
jgi:hypothetical protein